MRRKSLLIALGLVVFLAGSACGTMVILLRHEPSFYHQADIPPGAYRERQARECLRKLTDLYNGVSNQDATWGEALTADEVNSYLTEDFLRPTSLLNETMLPEGFHAPRVAIEPNRVRLAMRYGTGTWSTIVSFDLRVWLVAKQTNTVAIEMQGFQAGSLPITPQSLLEHISEAARPLNIEVNWYRHRGNPVALVRLQADQPEPTLQLRRLRITQGQIAVEGRSLVDSPRPAASSLSLKPNAE